MSEITSVRDEDVTLGESEITSVRQEEVTLGEVSETREEDAFSDEKHVLDIYRKRKRSDDDDEEEKEEEAVEEDNDGFKTPTRPENKIPKVRECPPAPRKGETQYSAIHKGRTMWCRRRLSFPPENTVRSLITDLQWRTTTMTIKK